MPYSQEVGVTNGPFRDAWVQAALVRHRPSVPRPTLLDVGAGDAPYRNLVVDLGYEYRSQDFAGYRPSDEVAGLQNASWRYADHDFVCDILEIPDSARSDVILCTEVLEHVPDPVRAFQGMARLLTPCGVLIVTVPFVSLMHQAPYWFQSGLSPYWFEHWAGTFEMDILELTVQGDYIDLMAQEVGRTLTFKRRLIGINRAGSSVIRKLRGRLPRSVLESGGLGTLFVGRRRV